MSLPLQSVTLDFSVAPQLDAVAMSAVAAAGFRSVINNRPDFEGGPEQPRHVDIEAAACAAGLEYRFHPVSGAYQSEEEIAIFRELLTTLPTPILAFCRSGARSTKLYLASQR